MSEWVCERCKSINRDAAITCYKCGSARGAVPVRVPEHDHVAGAPDGGAAPSDANPFPAEATAAMTPGAQMEAALPAGPGNLLGGLLGALIGGALGTAIWFGVIVVNEYQVGLIAIGVGWLVGTGAAIGAGRRGSIVLLPISALVTLVALAVSEYLVIFHFTAQAFNLEGIEIALIQPIDFIVTVVVESIQADPLTLLFWGLAVFTAVSVPWKLVHRSAS